MVLDCGFRIVDFGLNIPISDCRFQIVDSGFWIEYLYFGLHIADFRLQIRMEIQDSKNSIDNLKCMVTCRLIC